jgi:hypothetical protein
MSSRRQRNPASTATRQQHQRRQQQRRQQQLANRVGAISTFQASFNYAEEQQRGGAPVAERPHGPPLNLTPAAARAILDAAYAVSPNLPRPPPTDLNISLTLTRDGESNSNSDSDYSDSDSDADLPEPEGPPPDNGDGDAAAAADAHVVDNSWPPPTPDPNRTLPQLRINRPSKFGTYRSTMRTFMCYNNKINYPKDWEFSIQELAPITPEMICKYFCFRAYGHENASPDDIPTLAKSNTLLCWKKHISWFMVNRLIPWDDIHCHGNPTRSSSLNDLIATVKKKEARGQGKKSCADRPFETSEFIQVLTSLMDAPATEFDRKYRYPAMLKTMFHFIARGDDAAHIFKSSLVQSTEYPWMLMLKLRWSKNVNEHRDCPHQAMLGSMNPLFCVLIALAIFLEVWIERGQGRTSQWMFTDGVTTANSPPEEIEKETDRCKSGLYCAVKSIVKSPLFVLDPAVENSEYKLANHSTKKYATTHARRRGVLKDFTDVRARWKNKRMQETYADVVLPWPDIKSASVLCMGGICKYKIAAGVHISDAWLSDHVCPGISQCFGRSVAAILAKSLLWATMDQEWSEHVPEGLRTRILNALAEDQARLNVRPGENCVQKVQCVVSEYEGVITFTEVDASMDTSEGQATSGGGDLWKNILIGKVCGIENRMSEMENNHAGHYATIQKQMEKIDSNVKRLAMMPARCSLPASGVGGVGGSNESQPIRPANLCKCPKNLYVLWAEYESGVGGNKAARMFNLSERGKVRFAYCRRKIIWDTVDGLVRRGLTSDVAIDRIYSECGGPTMKVNQVIAKIKEFRKYGNPALHINPA